MGHELYKRKRVAALMERYEVLPLCGEDARGLLTPRPPCEVVEQDGAIVVRERGGDRVYTKEYFKGARQAVRLCEISASKRHIF